MYELFFYFFHLFMDVRKLLFSFFEIPIGLFYFFLLLFQVKFLDYYLQAETLIIFYSNIKAILKHGWT